MRLFIRGLQWDAQDANSTFAATLKTAARGVVKVADDGKLLIESQADGIVSKYSLPPTGDLTAHDISEVCSELLDKVDALTAATPSITDTNLVVGLLALYPSLRMVRQNFGVGIRRGGY